MYVHFLDSYLVTEKSVGGFSREFGFRFQRLVGPGIHAFCMAAQEVLNNLDQTPVLLYIMCQPFRGV